MPSTAKVFVTGNSQAIRLPKAFRVDVSEMWIARNEATGEIILKPKPDADSLQGFIDELRAMSPSEEFLQPRDDTPSPDPFAGWAA